MPKTFRQVLGEQHPLVLFGAYDALSARLIEQGGGQALFVSGFSVAGARYGVPDIGLVALGDIAAAVRDIAAACDLPALIDIDDGYGDVKNVVNTVRTYERMGVSAMMLEDQTWPKRCGHIAGKSVVPMERMAAKVRAATAERLHPETFIIARTDARAIHGLDDALRRAECYLKAGADGLFIEAPESVEELQIIGRAFDVPMLANPLEGGRSPILTPAEYAELGFSITCYGITLVLRAAKAMQLAIADIASGAFAMKGAGLVLEEFKEVIGFPGWAAIDDRYREG